MIPKPPHCRYEVAIIGLGYVGIPLALGFAEAGCRTLGFDLNTDRIRQLNGGASPFQHVPAERIAAARESRRLDFTDDKSRFADSEAIIICVPTPLQIHLDPDLRHIVSAGEEIAPSLRAGMLVSLESSTYPGTTREDLRRVLEEKSGLRAGVDFALAFSPEREDPGNAQSVLSEMPKVVGGLTADCTERAVELYSRAVKRVVPVADCDTAEAVKLTENIFRFINIALVNELKRIYEPMGIDIWEVVQAAGTKPFGFMPFYPGPGVGGHCIPIDPYYLTWKAREFGLDTHFIDLAGQINRAMPGYVVTRLVQALNTCARHLQGASVLVLGVAYKKDVSDDRESPAYTVMDLIKEHGAQVDYYDPFVPTVPAHGPTDRWANHRSIVWSPETLSRYQAAVVCTAHHGVDYAQLADCVPLIVDACHTVPTDRKARVVAA
jgi:UDP-N-acetyl-D-glucosamine dehydrogenase